MNGLDIAIIVWLCIAAVIGYKNGFLLTLFSLLALFLGVLFGFKLMGWAVLFLSSRFDINERWLPYLGFTLVFIAVLIMVTLLGRIIRSAVHKTFLGSIDNLAGLIMGVMKSAFLLSVFFWLIFYTHLPFPPQQWLDQSSLYPLISKIAPVATHWIGELIPALSGLFET